MSTSVHENVVLRRLKSLGCPESELPDVLQQQIVINCEQGVAWWGPMMSKSESNMLERFLKTGLHMIYQNEYISFKHILQRSKCKSLRSRRLELITSFSKQKFIKNEKHKTGFAKLTDSHPHHLPSDQ